MPDPSDAPTRARSLDQLEVPLERDGFARDLIRHLSGVLEDVVGLEEAAGFISIVGQETGESIGNKYKLALEVERLPRERLSEILVDLKRRIHGDFFVLSESDDRIVFGNRACPFGDRVLDRPALCMMTSNVFGSIAAGVTGYAKVVLDETIARGHAGCRVVVHLRPTDEAASASGREYHGPVETE